MGAQALEAPPILEAAPTLSLADGYQRRLLDFVGASDDVDLITVNVTTSFEAPYPASEYAGGGGYFAIEVTWLEKSARPDALDRTSDWDGLYPCRAQITNEAVAQFLDALVSPE